VRNILKMADLDTDKGLNAKISEKKDIVNQLCEDEKRGTSQSNGGMRDEQQGFDESNDDFFSLTTSNDDSQLKTFDIQEEKSKKLKDSVQRIFSLIPDMISVHDKEMNIIFSNWKGFADIPEEKRILNTKCYKTYRGLDQICPDCKARTVLNTKESIQKELELPEGIWIDLRVIPLIDENNDVELFVEWVRDITKRKETEQVLKKSEEENRSIVEIVPDIIFRINKNGEYIDVKTSSEDELAKPKEDLLKKNINDVFTSDVSSLILDTIRKAIATRKIQVVEYELAVPVGEKSFEARILRLNEDEVIAFVRDITEKKKVEIELQQNKDRLENLIKSSSEFIWQVDKNGLYTNVSDGVEKILGYKTSEIIGKTPFDFMKPSEAERVGKIFIEIVKKTERISHLEDTMIHKNGHPVVFETDGMPLFDERGEFDGYLGTCRDITERKEVERKLQKIFDMSSDLICEADINTATFTKINPAFTHVLGYSEEELLSKPFLDFVHPDDKKYMIQVIEKQLQQGEKVLSFSNRFRCKNGSYVYLDWNSHPVPEEGFTYAIARDVTNQKQLQEALVESEKKHRRLFETITQGVIYQDADGTISSANPAAERILGLSFEQMCGKTSMEPNWQMIKEDGTMVPGTDHPTMIALRTGQTIGPVTRGIYQPDLDSHIWLHITAIPLFQPDETKPFRAYAVFEDITRRKKAEEKLREREEHFRLIVDYSYDLIWTLKSDGVFSYVSPSFKAILGYEPSYMVNKEFQPFVHPDDIFKCETYMKRVLDAKKALSGPQYRVKHVDGGWRWHEATITPVYANDGSFMYFVGVSRDITVRKQMEEKLLESEGRFRDLVNNTPDFIYSLNRERRHTAVNRSVCKALGLEEHDIIGKNHSELGFPEDICHEWRKLHDKVFSTKQVVKAETITPMPDGTEHTYEVVLTPIFDENENVTGIRGISRDITESKQAVELLKQSEIRFQNIFENKGTAMGLFGDDGIITLCNFKFVELSGFRKEEILNRMKWSDFVVKEDLERMMRYHKQRSEGANSPSEYECDVVNKKGERRTMIVNIGVMPNSQLRIVSLTDITKQKTAEKELIKMHDELKRLNQDLEMRVEQRTEQINQLLKQKDEFINQLGHDLKNPLGPFVHLLPVLKNHVSDEKDKQMVEVLMRNTCYMRNLVKKTIDLAKLNSSKTKFTFEDVSLGDLVEEVVAVNSSLFEDYGVVVENNVCSACLVHADPLHIQEVFTNIFNNAVKYSDKDRWIGIDAVEQDDCVLVFIRDKGIGISEDQLPFLFDEYYKADTSRHDFDSSGLGLPICKRIIEKHGGKIWVESEGLGKGSTFYFTLPKK